MIEFKWVCFLEKIRFAFKATFLSGSKLTLVAPFNLSLEICKFENIFIKYHILKVQSDFLINQGKVVDNNSYVEFGKIHLTRIQFFFFLMKLKIKLVTYFSEEK